MKNKIKSFKTSLILIIGVTFIMTAAASASADIISRESDSESGEIVVDQDIPIDEGNLILPGPEEPLIIAPDSNILPEQTDYTDDLVIAGDTTDKSQIKDIGLTGFAVIVIIAGIAAALIIIGGKNK